MSDVKTIRYRTEAFSGLQYRDAAEVMAFETFDLGNADILEHLSNGVLKNSEEISRQCAEFIDELDRNGFIDDFSAEDGVEFYRNVLSEIKRVTGHDIKYALWLADLDTVKDFYGKDMVSQDDYDAYEIGSVVLSDLGYEGTLYGYVDVPEPVFIKESKEGEKMSYWPEIKNDYFEAYTSPKEGEALASVSIDAPASENDREFKTVIARVLLSQHGDVLVDYHDPLARNDEMAQNAISEARARLHAYFQEHEQSTLLSKTATYQSPLDLFIEAEVPFRMKDLLDLPLTKSIEENLICYVQNNNDIMFNYDHFDDCLLDKYHELVAEALKSYEGVIDFLCASLNSEDGAEQNRKTEEFSPIFESTNYFGVYFYNGDNEYYLVNKISGEYDLVLGDSPDFVGKNYVSDYLQDEQVLDIANDELLGYLIEFSRENTKGLIPERELSGIHVLENALSNDPVRAMFEDIKRQLDEQGDCTAYGEPQAWVSLENGRSIEVTLEQAMLPENKWFYSVRLHCTEEEFDNGDYHSTCGIINTLASTSANIDQIKGLLRATLRCNEQYPIAEHSKKRSALDDRIADAETTREANQKNDNKRSAKDEPERS